MRKEVKIIAWYVLISFILNIFFTYNVVYYIVDKLFLFSTSGSKLRKVSNISSFLNFTNLYISKEKLCVIGSLFIIFLVLYTINLSFVLNFFSNNYFTVSLFNKNIDFVYLFAEKYRYLKYVYAVTSFAGLGSMVWNSQKYVSNILFKFIQRRIVKEKDTSGNTKEPSIIMDENVTLPLTSLYENLLITGSIGSGKTTGIVAPLCEQLVSLGINGLILDAKGNFVHILNNICNKVGKPESVQVISTSSNYYFEIMEESLSPLELASRFRRVIELISENNISDSYFWDKVENVLFNLIILMDYVDKKRELLKLHRLVTSKSSLTKYIQLCKERIKQKIPSTEMSYTLSNVLNFIEGEYLNLDERTYSIITSEITRITIPLVTDYNIYNQFFVKGNKKKIDFNSNIVILSINIGENKALCKIIATFLKLSFQKWILSEFNKTNPTFFICDEYQEFVNKDDASFLSLSREAKCINIISTQSYSSLKNALNSESSASVIVQNFVNKIWFRNEDNYTVSEAIKQLGKSVIKRENSSITENAKTSQKYLFKPGFKNYNSNLSTTLNYVFTKEYEYDENFFSRGLRTYEALGMFNIEGQIQVMKLKFKRWC